MPVLSKDRPQDIRHGEHKPHVWNVGEVSRQFALPEFGGAVSTTRAGSRLARVRYDLCLQIRREDFSTQGQGSTPRHLVKVIANHETKLISIPERSCTYHYFLQMLFNHGCLGPAVVASEFPSILHSGRQFYRGP